MRKSLLKTIAITAVVGVTLALSSTFAFAGTEILYKIDDYVTNKNITALTAGTDNDKKISNKAETKLFDTDNKYVVTTSKSDSFGAYQSAVNGYTSVMVSGNGQKDVLTVSDLSEGDIITVYFGSSNAKYEQAKQITAKLYNNDDETKFATAKSSADFNKAYELSYTIPEGGAGTYTLTNTTSTNRFNLYAIKIEVNDNSSDSLTEATYTGTNGLVIVKDNTVYAIGKTDNITPDSVVLNVGNYTSSAQPTVFKNVCDSTGADILGTNKKDGYYYIGVTVTGVTNDAAAEALADLISIEEFQEG